MLYVREIQHVLTTICLYMTQKAHMAGNYFVCLIETEGLLKVTDNHVHCKCGDV